MGCNKGLEKPDKSSLIADRISALRFGNARVLGIAAQEVAGQEGVIDMSSGDPDFDAPLHVREAAKKAIDEGFTHYAGYPAGMSELLDAIAEKLSRDNNIAVDPNKDILTVEGGHSGIVITMETLINQGDEVIIPDPHFYPISRAVKYAGGKPIFVNVTDERDYRPDPADIEKKVTDKTKMIVLVSPHNPTGSVLTMEDLEAISEIAKKHDLLVFSDEVYEAIVFDGRKHYSIASLPGMKERTITLNGLIKTYALTGWRVAYLVADERYMNVMKELHAQWTVCVNTIAQKAAIAALRGPQDFPGKMREEYEIRRNIMVEELNKMPGISCRKPWGTYYVYPKISGTGLNSLEFAKYIAKEVKVIFQPASGYGDGGEGYLRAATTLPREKIREGLERVKSAVEKLK
jgi:aspartate/methionine/tyrosine aminotransferase